MTPKLMTPEKVEMLLQNQDIKDIRRFNPEENSFENGRMLTCDVLTDMDVDGELGRLADDGVVRHGAYKPLHNVAALDKYRLIDELVVIVQTNRRVTHWRHAERRNAERANEAAVGGSGED